MMAPPRDKVLCKLAALTLACCAQTALGAGRAEAQPPSVCIAATIASVHTPRPLPLPDRAPHAQRPCTATATCPGAATAKLTLDAQPTHDAQPTPTQDAQPTHDKKPAHDAQPAHSVQPPQPSHPPTQRRADKHPHAPVAPKQLPPLPSVFERFGGAHAKRAMQVAQGIPTGRVALRPMFWMTRDQRGGMVALGGRF